MIARILLRVLNFAVIWLLGLLLTVARGPAAEKTAATTLNEGIVAAQQSRQPILAIAGGQSCPYCRQLEKEMQKEEVRQELKRWTVVSIDVDQSPDDAQSLAVRAIPALRLLTPAGKVVTGREGALPAAELIDWLQENFDTTSAPLIPELTSTGELTALQAVRLARELGRRDATLREAAVRRLMTKPEVAAPPVANAFVEGSLAARLAALEILGAWKAPVEGLDPWRPETITQQRLEALTEWAANPTSTAPPPSVEELSQSLTQSVADQLRRMLAAPPTEAAAIRERLARYGRLLLPLMYERLAAAESDEARQRLTALRYRLVANDELALTWPGGIERLAASDARTRRSAMTELAGRVTQADEPLLLELFSDPEPLIRELSLQALYKTSGKKANSALVRLLDDPDANVQAAVLKQLAEAPAPGALPRLRTYVEQQHDPDLVVHAIRVLRQTKNKSALESVVGLLKHENWRVRAEAAEATGEAVGEQSLPDEDKADAYVALVELLKDDDPFVVSRAVKVLAKARLAIAINPLAEVAARHPALTVEVVKALADSGAAQLKVAEHLRQFVRSDDPKVRAAAVKGLCELKPEDLDVTLEVALADPAEAVRIAAAESLFEVMEEDFRQQRYAEDAESSAVRRSLLSRGLSALTNLFSDEGEKPSGGRPQAVQAAGALADRESVKLPEWVRKLAIPLRKMLEGDTPAERFAASLPLVALGELASSVTVLEAAVSEDRARIPAAAKALPWLPWAERERFFKLLISAARGTDDIAAAAQGLVPRPHPAATALVWDLLARPDANGSLTSSLMYALRVLQVGARAYDAQSIPKRQLANIVKEIRPRAETGTRWQRMAALSLLVGLDAAAVEDVTRQLMDDPSLDAELRADAFRILLYVAEDDVARKEALLALRAENQDRHAAAIALLARGRGALQRALQDLDSDGARAQLFDTSPNVFGLGTVQSAIPAVPAGLNADMLRPLLRTGHWQQRADAAYLLCLLGEEEGLTPLVEHWKRAGKNDQELTKLVYRSVAALDDSGQMPLLGEIYQSLAAKEDTAEQEVAEFYWTIRSMTGPEVLALRKRIRDDFGIETLQRNNPFGDASSGVRF